MEIVDYIIVEEDTTMSLRSSVIKKIKLGYTPQGGVSISKTVNSYGDYRRSYAQAMIK